jgi:HEAT repeat protein
MNSIDNLDDMCKKVQASFLQEDGGIYGTGIWKLCHQLAKAGFQPAKEIFVQGLDDSRWDWRRESISLLGFHYNLNEKIVEKIRHMAINDSESGVRISAVSVLGRYGKFPDKTLVQALLLDTNKYAKQAAFSALLDNAAIPYKIKMKEMARIRRGELKPTLENVKKVLEDNNFKSFARLLDEIGNEDAPNS